jgi:hypothetical protein
MLSTPSSLSRQSKPPDVWAASVLYRVHRAEVGAVTVAIRQLRQQPSEPTLLVALSTGLPTELGSQR